MRKKKEKKAALTINNFYKSKEMRGDHVPIALEANL